MYFPKCPTCQHAASDVAAQPSARTAPEKKDEAGEGRQRCSLTLLMLITSIYCAHNMGAAPNQQLLPHLPTRNSAAPWTSFLLLFLLLRLRATHASLDTLWGRWWPPHYPTLLLWTLFSFLFLYTPPGKIQLSNANFSSRFYFPSFFFFLCSPRFRFEYFFLFQPKASQDELSAYQHLFAVDLCSEHPIPPTTPIFSAPLGLFAQSNNRHRHRHPLHVPIHIHVQIQIQIQSAVEYLPSMLIEFFPVD